MIPRRAVSPALAALAERQAGAVSRAQALEHGLTDRVIARLLRTGAWRQLARGVYGLTEETWLQRAWAGLLLGGDGAVLGKSAAGYLQKIVAEPPDPITVYIRPSTSAPRDPRWTFIRADRPSTSAPPPKTTPALTVVDIARDLDADGLAALVARAMTDAGISPTAIQARLRQTTRHPNRTLLQELLVSVVAGAMSPLEVRYLRDVERAHGLPAGERQAGPTGAYRADVWYRDYALIVELDGRAYHRGLAAGRDADRDIAHRLQGQTTLRFTWAQVAGHPCQTAAQVAQMLTQAGWPGPFRRCPNCPPQG
jgi:hypothetical protein